METLKASDTKNAATIGTISPKITRNTSEIAELKPIVEALGQNDTEIGEQLTALGKNDTEIGEQMTKLGQNDESIMAEINAMKARIFVYFCLGVSKLPSPRTKDPCIIAKIAELEKRPTVEQFASIKAERDARPTFEQIRDARAGAVVLTVDPNGDNITLDHSTIEQSDNLIEWTKLDGEMTRTIPIPDGKKFYRFALDK